MHRFCFLNIDKFLHVLANGTLAIFIKCRRKPERAPVRQRTKTSVEMVKTRINQLDRDDEAAEHVRHCAMRIDVRTELISAEKRLTVEQRIAFSLEIEFIRQPRDFVTVLFHPARKMRRFAGALFMPKIARDEFFPNG